MKVKILRSGRYAHPVSAGTAQIELQEGQEIDLPEVWAESIINSGGAEAIVEKASKPAKTAKKATRKSKG